MRARSVRKLLTRCPRQRSTPLFPGRRVTAGICAWSEFPSAACEIRWTEGSSTRARRAIGWAGKSPRCNRVPEPLAIPSWCASLTRDRGGDNGSMVPRSYTSPIARSVTAILAGPEHQAQRDLGSVPMTYSASWSKAHGAFIPLVPTASTRWVRGRLPRRQFAIAGVDAGATPAGAGSGAVGREGARTRLASASAVPGDLTGPARSGAIRPASVPG